MKPLRKHSIENLHPEYLAKRDTWHRYDDLYTGGEQLQRRAVNYLVRRHEEPTDIYVERLARIFYENYIGSIIDWYSATLLRREPVIQFQGDDLAGKKFMGEFIQDCDRKGSTLTDFFRARMTDALIYGRSYIAIDFPRISTPAHNRLEEDVLGKSRAYLTSYSPDQVTNWGRNAQGELDWIVVRTEARHQPSLGAEAVQETIWTYYDREVYETYRRTGDSGEAVLSDSGPHALTAQRRVPVIEMKTSDGLWLMNRAALLQIEHLNKSNALAWALTMGLFATPVIYSDREWKQVIGESYYIQLGSGDRFGWTEPEGKVFSLAAQNLDRLKDEIYRVCYLLSQAGRAESSGVPQSGLRKQMDFNITHEILRAYGDMLKGTVRQVLQSIADARQDDLIVEVSGLDEFDIGDFAVELDNARSLLQIGIQSKTLKEQIYKKLAFKYLSDSSQETKNRVAAEIDEGLAGQS